MIWGCTQKIVFPISPAVPAAKAEAKIKQDKNGNAQVQLSVRHLAPPERLHPPQKVYVVWVPMIYDAEEVMSQLRNHMEDAETQDYVTGALGWMSFCHIRFLVADAASDDDFVLAWADCAWT